MLTILDILSNTCIKVCNGSACIMLCSLVLACSACYSTAYSNAQIGISTHKKKIVTGPDGNDLLGGYMLTLSELMTIQQDLKQQELKNSLVGQESTRIKPYLFWWQTIPMIGLRLEEPFWPPAYPFIPHMFALWQLAPHMGKKSTVYAIDTGLAACTFTREHKIYKKHQDLPDLPNFSTISVHSSMKKYTLIHSETDFADPF